MVIGEEGIIVQRIRRFGPLGWYKVTVGLSDELHVYNPFKWLCSWDLHDYSPEHESDIVIDYFSKYIPRKNAKEIVNWVNEFYQ